MRLGEKNYYIFFLVHIYDKEKREVCNKFTNKLVLHFYFFCFYFKIYLYG